MSDNLKPITVEGKLNAILDDLHEIKLRLSSLENRLAERPYNSQVNTQTKVNYDCGFDYPKYHD